MHPTKKPNELRNTLAYFAICAFVGYIASLIYPLDPTVYFDRPIFFPPKIFKIYNDASAWIKYALAAFFTSFSVISVYGRINTNVFSRIPPDRVRKDVGHIVKYTVVPIFITICYLMLFLKAEFGVDLIP
jgi:hypothetical protein